MVSFTVSCKWFHVQFQDKTVTLLCVPELYDKYNYTVYTIPTMYKVSMISVRKILATQQ